jgi:mannose-6-phosphate isomerase-like protein (cupin superfamily)
MRPARTAPTIEEHNQKEIVMVCEAKNLDTPDDKRSFDHGQIALVNLPGTTIGRATFAPGWQWSTDVKPTAGTDSCQLAHTAYVISGRMGVRMDDGTEIELGPGDAHVVGPGHDAWVLGQEPLVTIDFQAATQFGTPGNEQRVSASTTRAQGRVVRAEAREIFKASGSNTDGRFELMVLDVGYLFGPPLHIHDAQEDSFYVLEGVLTVQVGDTVVDLNPGDFATAPPGVAHTFTNTARDKVARTVNIMTPGIGFDRYIAAAMSGIEPSEMKRLGNEYGVTMVGPSLPQKLGLA